LSFFCFKQNEAIIFFFCLPIQQRTKNWKNKKVDVYREKQDYFLFSKRNTVLEIASKVLISNFVSVNFFNISIERKQISYSFG
jgi:hypothetical protein